ncbi:TPA: adenylate/guanylate cyclase domain-containing protein [Candidatus Poribacteria bacterium]|nr:adenylate/guanylate cyclase domain-containing protein [Candidatus Poribacteria bacterium]
MSDKKKRFRIDFVWEIKSYDEATGTYTVKLVPNPIRYELKEVEGKQCLYDKLDKLLIPKEVLLDLAKQAEGQPIYFQPEEIGNSAQYVKSRMPIIKARLQGNERPAPFEDKSEAFLEALAQDKLGFVIMCVDIVGSTKLAINLEQEAYVRLISTALYEMSEIIPKFHGFVLKYTGDGLIGYFPEPSFITKNDLAMDCALTIRRLVYRGLNPILKEEGYSGIDIRIGLDSGEAYIVTIGSPEAKRHKDILGAVVSLAAKIQSLGGPGDILLGDVTLRNLHTMWRQICEEVELGRNWEYKDEEGKPYKVHKVKFKE